MHVRVCFSITCITLLMVCRVTQAEQTATPAQKRESAQTSESGQKTAQGIAFFEKRILPQLQQHCDSCHSAKAKKLEGGLRLDTRAGLRAGGDTGAIIVPGKPSESLLIRALKHDDLEMPPSKKLPDRVIADFVKWVEMGAPDPRKDAVNGGSKHWSFQPIRSVLPPTVNNRHWARNGIDAFILARLEQERVQPSPPASPATLLRRVSLDLTGLPPTPAELDSFLKDPSPRAYERVVSRLLASPHYAERWGRYWLDMARYADSDGYEGDRGRPYAWRWRDWVIGALDADMPFDQFTIEQLAGDLLPHATAEQRVATGLHRNTLSNREGGVDSSRCANRAQRRTFIAGRSNHHQAAAPGLFDYPRVGLVAISEA